MTLVRCALQVLRLEAAAGERCFSPELRAALAPSLRPLVDWLPAAVAEDDALGDSVRFRFAKARL